MNKIYDQSAVKKIPMSIIMAIKFDNFPDMMHPETPDEEEYPSVLI